MPWVEVAPGHVRDEWGVVWNRTVDEDIGIVENRVLAEASLEGWAPPEPRPAELLHEYPLFIARYPDRYRLASVGISLYERAWTLRGMDNLLMDMLERPEFVHALFDRITEYNLAQIELACAYDIDGVWIGDDWGSQSGLIMGPALWREFLKPRVTRMYQRIRQHGKRVFIHSCGDVKELLPELIEAGLDVFNPFQPEVLDVFETKRRFAGRLSFWGGISVQRLLPHGTPEEVRRETKELLARLGEGGGYIAAPSHAMTADIPPKNMMALIEVLQEQ